MREDPLAYRLYRKAIHWHQSVPADKHVRLRHGFEWLIKVSAARRARRLGMRFPERTIGGWWWTWRWRWEILMQWYEYDTLQWCRKLVQPGMVAVDIGAHIGSFTLLLSELVGESGRVIAFEPDPDNFELLQHNIAARACTNTEAVCLAVANDSGKSELFLASGSSTHSLIAGFNNNVGSVVVKTATLDNFLATMGTPSIDFVKIDVEGAEPLVLSGMAETIRRNPRLRMIVELNARALKSGGHTADQLVSQLEAFGFSVNLIGQHGQLVPVPRDPRATCNLLCVPRDGGP